MSLTQHENHFAIHIHVRRAGGGPVDTLRNVKKGRAHARFKGGVQRGAETLKQT
jgi:hypothetical protein